MCIKMLAIILVLHILSQVIWTYASLLHIIHPDYNPFANVLILTIEGAFNGNNMVSQLYISSIQLFKVRNLSHIIH